MNQTRLSSLLEAMTNILIGFNLNYWANLVIFPLFDLHISMSANFVMGLIYTVISVVRSYALRRWFNAHLHDASASIAAWWIRVRTGKSQEVTGG